MRMWTSQPATRFHCVKGSPPSPSAGSAKTPQPSLVGSKIAHGTDPTIYDHYSILRSIETAFGLPHLAKAGDRNTADIPALAARG